MTWRQRRKTSSSTSCRPGPTTGWRRCRPIAIRIPCVLIECVALAPSVRSRQSIRVQSCVPRRAAWTASRFQVGQVGIGTVTGQRQVSKTQKVQFHWCCSSAVRRPRENAEAVFFSSARCHAKFPLSKIVVVVSVQTVQKDEDGIAQYFDRVVDVPVSSWMVLLDEFSLEFGLVGNLSWVFSP